MNATSKVVTDADRLKAAILQELKRDQRRRERDERDGHGVYRLKSLLDQYVACLASSRG